MNDNLMNKISKMFIIIISIRFILLLLFNKDTIDIILTMIKYIIIGTNFMKVLEWMK